MPDSLTANQLVAYNLMRIRKTLGLDQAEAAARLEPYLGVRWSKAVYSAAERSYHGSRVRQFTADDLIALSRAFGVPVAYFFLPPRPGDRENGHGLRSGNVDISWPELFEVMVGGDYRAALLHRVLELPAGERPPANSHAGVVLAQMSANRASAWDGGSAPYTAGDPRLMRAQQAAPADLRPAVVAAIVTSDRGVLVGRRNDATPPWTFIAGEQEPDELPQDTVEREVKEETGVEVAGQQIIGERVHPATGRRMIYVAAAPTHETSLIVGDEAELAEVRWVSLADAEELMGGTMYPPVREYLARELEGRAR